MSNIYIQEPPTNGKVLLKTTVGDIDVELWSKEAPLACRNFVQLCLEGYYDNTIFHRVVKGFIVQGGDPTGTGSGGESIYGDPFKDEIHSRLRFNRRGLVAMANAGTNDNGSQFFFTLGATPELQKKHTIFAKVAGKTIYNMIKLEEGDIDSDDRPAYPNKITGAEILNNPFPDIVPRIKTSKKSENDGVKKTVKAKAVKDFKLLSFGEEAEDDEEEIHEINKNFTGKTKHMPGLEESEEKLLSEGAKRKHDESESDDEELEHVKQIKVDSKPCGTEENSASIKKVRDKLNRLNKNISDHNEVSTSKLSWDENEKTPSPSKLRSNAMLDEYKKNQSEYGDIKKKLPPKGAKQTIDILAKFREKINKLRKTGDENETGKEESDDRDLLVHSLKCEDKLTLAKDANVKSDDWFEITDPRNTLNKRRRENSKFSKTRIKEELK